MLHKAILIEIVRKVGLVNDLLDFKLVMFAV